MSMEVSSARCLDVSVGHEANANKKQRSIQELHDIVMSALVAKKGG